ncbi:MAG: hypothetical protein HYU28_01800 [Actinobacteria bacterium]|nr:hypothetical protein [Actinomycetota bacterium]
MPNLRDSLRQLSERGDPRGAARVLASARASLDEEFHGRRSWLREHPQILVAAAAAAVVVASVAVTGLGEDDDRLKVVTGGTSTTSGAGVAVPEPGPGRPPATTTTVAVPGPGPGEPGSTTTSTPGTTTTEAGGSAPAVTTTTAAPAPTTTTAAAPPDLFGCPAELPLFGGKPIRTVDAGGGSVFALLRDEPTLGIVDPEDRTGDTVSLPSGQTTADVEHSGSTAYVGAINSSDRDVVDVVNVATRTVSSTIALDDESSTPGVKIAVANGDLYVARPGLFRIDVVDPSTGETSGQIVLSRDPSSIVASSERVYVVIAPISGSGDPWRIKVINPDDNLIVATIDLAGTNGRLTIDTASARLYVAQEGANVEVINLSNNEVVATVSGTAGADHVAVLSGKLYVARDSEDTVEIYNASTRVKEDTVSGFDRPTRLAVASGAVFVRSDDPPLSAIDPGDC